jgi:hypothetical protein
MTWIKRKDELLMHMTLAEVQIPFEDKDIYRSKYGTGLTERDTDWIHVEQDAV